MIYFGEEEQHINKSVLNIEDDVCKHAKICRALEKMGIEKIDIAKTAEKGIEMIESALESKTPYDILIVDMEFPVHGEINSEAGIYVIEELQRKHINIPIIVCSSLRYGKIENTVGSIFYNESRDLDEDLRELFSTIR